ncbi:MAG: DUF4446 family protein [Firmicutes bacterium]|nr:DUF4446 family protein [Alicyclobacillaceae bacterium]MCL6496130.1 DUF4446 family protein [Bacillota bacterium]
MASWWTIWIRTAPAPLLAGLAVAVGLALLAGLGALVAWRRAARLERRLRVWLDGPLDSPLKEALDQSLRQGAELQDLREQLERYQRRGQHTLSRFGLVRYNAFPDSAAELSFSLALLTEGGDGLVLTGLWGRDEVRVYAKEVAQEHSRHVLTPEERQAIALAMSRRLP